MFMFIVVSLRVCSGTVLCLFFFYKGNGYFWNLGSYRFVSLPFLFLRQPDHLELPFRSLKIF